MRTLRRVADYTIVALLLTLMFAMIVGYISTQTVPSTAHSGFSLAWRS